MSSPTILIVEDNPVTRKMARVTLQSEGYTVFEAGDGQSALELMVSHPPDMVLQDLLLPDIDGFDLFQRLRALPEGAEIPILAFSGFLPGLEQARSSQVGFTDYLFKPIEPSRLLETIRIYLQPGTPRFAGYPGQGRPGKARRIVAADDDPIQLKLLTVHLEQMGFQVIPAADGAEALALARRAAPDAIVSDVLMPNLDGFRLCQAVRQDPQLADIPVVLTSSSYAEEEDQRLARTVGANAFVLRTPDCREVAEALIATESQPPHHGVERGALRVESPDVAPLNSQRSPLNYPAAELAEGYVYRVIRQLEHQASLNISLSTRLAVLEAQFAVFTGLAETLKRTAAVDTVMEELLHRSLDAAGVSMGAAYLLESDGRLSLQSQLGHSGTAEAGLPEFFGHTSLLHSVMAAGEPVSIPFPGMPEEETRDLLNRAGARSMLIMPLVLDAKRLGVLVMTSVTQDLSQEWVPFARAVGSQLSQAIGLARALTERQLLEEQLLQAQKMEAVGRLAGGVAHDFNNMIGAITGYADLLLHRLAPDEAVHSALQEIMKAADRAAILTRQLLLFSRKEAPAPRVLDLNEVIADVHKMLRRLIGEDIEMVALPNAAVGRVRADPGQIEQVLLNLAINARDAMPEGGRLTIRISSNVECIPYSVSDKGGPSLDSVGYEIRNTHYAPRLTPWVLLEVSDTGCGMDAETQARIFEPFFTTKEPGKGTGLGLATVYAIIDQAGGQIQVDSAPGQGTTFRIYLPQTEEEKAPEPAAEAAAAPSSGSETILLAEDEPIMQQLVRTILEAHGYTVLEATQGDEALRLCQQHEGAIDLLLADVVMPGMNGRELAERANALRPEMKVLFMSGYTDDAVLLHGVREADVNFLPKPFTPSELARRVREVLEAG